MLNPLSCVDTPENRKQDLNRKLAVHFFIALCWPFPCSGHFVIATLDPQRHPVGTEVAIRYATEHFRSSCDSYTYVAIANTIFTLNKFLLTTFQSAVFDNLSEIFLNNFDNAMPICMRENITENLNFKNSTEVQNVQKQKDGHVSASFTLKIWFI